MDWTKGYSAQYYASIVDRATMRDLGTSRLDISAKRNPNRIEVLGGSIKNTYQDLRQSAALTCADYIFTDEQIIRVWLDARQDGGSSHTPLFTGLAASPKKSYKGVNVTHNVECYSLLKIADDILLPRGWYAPIGIDGPTIVADLLKVVGVEIHINPIESSARTLSQTLLAESGETYLTMSDFILNTIGWYLHMDGYGDIYLDPIPQQEDGYKFVLGALNDDVIELSFDREYDWYSTPNVFQATLDNLSAVARDDDPDSKFSTVRRGREIWVEETDCALNDNETLAEYAYRRLKELQDISMTANYTRRYNPDINPLDIIRLNYQQQGLIGDFRVLSQTIDLGYSAKTSEEVIQL